MTSFAARLSTVLVAASLAACGGAPPPGVSGPHPAIAPEGVATPSNLKVVSTPSRPRLALLTRDGDPSPAMVAVVATDLGSSATVALSALLEARLLALLPPFHAPVARPSCRPTPIPYAAAP